MRDVELMKAEHFLTTNDLLCSEYCNTKNAWQTVYVYDRIIRYAVDCLISGRRKGLYKLGQVIILFLRHDSDFGVLVRASICGNTNFPNSNTRRE